jgi:Ino eighty subunit 2
METINKLLKKQAPKTNARRRDLTGVAVADATPDGESQRPNSIFIRWVSNREGDQIGVPEEWIDSPVGAMFVGEVGS